MAVLELLAGHPDERFTLSEVARRCDLNKATAHALLSALTDRGVLLRHPDGEALLARSPAGRHRRRGPPRLHRARLRCHRSSPARRRDGPAGARLAGDGRPRRRASPRPDCRRTSTAAPPLRLPLAPPVGAAVHGLERRAHRGGVAGPGRARSRRCGLRSTRCRPSGGRASRSRWTSPEWRALSSPAPRRGAGESRRRHRPGGAAVAAGRHLPPAAAGRDVDDGRSYQPAEVDGAGVRRRRPGRAGGVGDGARRARRDRRRELLALGRRVVAAADALTEAVRGRRP